jgi:large subunit ribosomal protein L18
MKVKTKKDRRERIRLRQRRRLSGTPERPRLAVVRSLAHISVQAIDDAAGRTVISASSMESSVKAALADGAGGGNTAGAQVVGRLVAERLLQQGIKRVVFDRGGVLYHGRVRSVADAAREAGLEF